MNRFFFSHFLSCRWSLLALGFGLFMAAPLSAHTEVMNQYEGVRSQLDEAILDLLGKRPLQGSWKQLGEALKSWGKTLQSPEGKKLHQEIQQSFTMPPPLPMEAVKVLGKVRGQLQHLLAMEMIFRQRQADLPAARTYRALIDMPKHASAIKGSLALQRMGNQSTQREGISQLLAREHLMWQTTRIREKVDALQRLLMKKRSVPELLALRASEIQALASFPSSLREWADSADDDVSSVAASSTHLDSLLASSTEQQLEAFRVWHTPIESSLPQLLSAEDVERQERLLFKLLRLITKEYQAGVRNGEVVVPIEYREAEAFTIQAQQIVAEVHPYWKKSQPEVWEQHGARFQETLTGLEKKIAQKAPSSEVYDLSQHAQRLLEDSFGVSIQRGGSTAEIVQEASLEIRTLLKDSLRAARAGRWSEAESLRLEAYTSFDLEIEPRVLPRDPSLALEVERQFLDGDRHQWGIKAALDARADSAQLEAAFRAALEGLDECQALIQIGMSPATVVYTSFTIVVREGLEAVVILAALLAGFRGEENRPIRRRLASGAWLALAATGLTFFIGHYLIQSLSRYGEKLEAVISLLAVLILLMVTNWVFHKVYWVQWNARLRSLSRSVDQKASQRWESLAMVGVGFMTIYREGFETTLFLQSLILEGGWGPVLIGLTLAGSLIAALGFAIFWLGAKLPYRKLLVVTGFLVVSILVTFLGSTVRLFQTVGWMPIHPISWLDIPPWMGLWLGLYPSWEGISIPLLGLAYVAGAWLWVKWSAARQPLTSRVSSSSGDQGKSRPASFAQNKVSKGSYGTEKKKHQEKEIIFH